jgi:hypothetical protein
MKSRHTSASTEPVSAQEAVHRRPSRPCRSAFRQCFFCLLLLVLCPVPAALGQSQSQAPPQPQPQSQPPSQPQQKEESLGDAARKARAKKGKPEPGKVYTDDDLSGLRGSVSVVGQDAPAGAASPDAGNSDAGPGVSGAAKSGNDEKYWRGRARALLDRMAALDGQISKLKDEIKKYGNGGFDAATGLQQNVIYIQDRAGQVKNLEKQKEDLQKQMDTLQEEGRKAGASPAWFR